MITLARCIVSDHLLTMINKLLACFFNVCNFFENINIYITKKFKIVIVGVTYKKGQKKNLQKQSSQELTTTGGLIYRLPI